MNKKIIALMLITIIGIMTAGCGPSETTNSKSKGTEELTRDLGLEDVIVGASQNAEARMTEANQQKLMAANPAPQLSKSLERENLIKRLNLLNDQNKIFYVYLVSYGKVMAYYTAQGKVSSVNSKLTTQEQVVFKRTNSYGKDITGLSGVSIYSGSYVVESPDLDGSYGTNGDAIFFFTTEGAYVEWAGEYMLSDYPLALSTPPELVRSLK